MGRPGTRLAPPAVAAALAAFAIVTFLRFREAHSRTGSLAPQARALAVALLALAVFSASTLLIRRVQWKWPLFRPGLAAALAFVCAAELFYQGRRLYRYRQFEQTPADSPLLSALRRQPDPFRVLGDDYLLYPNTNVLARLEEVRTHDPVERREYVALLDAAAGYPPADYFKQVRDVNAPIFDFLNVRYFIGRPGTEPPGAKWRKLYAGPEGTLFENTKALPRVTADPAAEIDDYVERTNSISFRVRAGGGPTRLRLSVLQDGGWKASSDGVPIRTSRAHGPFLALEVPKGDHTIRLRYLSPGFAPGSAVTAGTIAILGIAAFRRGRRRPKTTP
jgi:hypothetical protein